MEDPFPGTRLVPIRMCSFLPIEPDVSKVMEKMAFTIDL